MKKILVTGGAGFIGSFLVDSLLAAGHRVVVIDSLETQVHHGRKPDYLNKSAEYIWGNLTDSVMVDRALKGVAVVAHLAAIVGVAQSMYEIERYTRGNTLSAAMLLEGIRRMKDRPEKILTASSMSVYGEGAYVNEKGSAVLVGLRSREQLSQRRWELVDPTDKQILRSVPTPESKPLQPASVYAIGKRDHEELFHVFGRAYGVPSVAFRFFNAYGPRQSLNNPYTGVAAIFCSRLVNGLRPKIFEDGQQQRDFVHVLDVVDAMMLALDNAKADFETVNIGSGEVLTVEGIGEILSQAVTEGRIASECTGDYREGDIRHCYADITKARKLLGYNPKRRLVDHATELCEWVRRQSVRADSFDSALREAKQAGVIR